MDQTMVRKTKAEAEQTREALLDAAEDLFFEKGVARTTLNEISRAAGVTRGALYWHFTNKEAIIMALIERATLPIDMLLADIAEADPGARDLLDRTRQVFLRAFEHMASSPRQHRIFTILIQGTELVDKMQPVQDHFDQKSHRLTEALSRVLKRCAANGELRTNLDPVVAARSIHAFIIGIHILCLRCAQGWMDLARDAPGMIDLFFDGLAAPPSPPPSLLPSQEGA